MNVDGTEGRLVERARKGDRRAFGELVERHWSRLVRLARSIVGEADAEDGVQESFLLAWRKLSSLRDADAFPRWITRITVRVCIRSARSEMSVVAVESMPEPPGSGRNETELDVERLLLSLPPRQRAVMHMTIVEGMTDKEIGAILNVRAASVRAHRRRARDSLSKLLRKEVKTWMRPVRIL
jgi:RNA polymerase sigma-70 factor (ECF subfamily)